MTPTSSRTSLRSDSVVCWTTPGGEAMGCGSSILPHEQRRHQVVGRQPGSATSRRIAGVVRNRRIRRWG